MTTNQNVSPDSYTEEPVLGGGVGVMVRSVGCEVDFQPEYSESNSAKFLGIHPSSNT